MTEGFFYANILVTIMKLTITSALKTAKIV